MNAETTFPLQSIRQKGVSLLVFSGEDKAEYESESCIPVCSLQNTYTRQRKRMLRHHYLTVCPEKRGEW